MADTIDLTDEDAEYTCKELRQKIGVLVGRRQNPESSLHIGTLNSIYAHLTGEFHTSPKEVGTPLSPGVERIRWAVVVQVSNFGYDMSSYIPDPGEGTKVNHRPLRKDELEEMAVCLNETEDQREWLKA